MRASFISPELMLGFIPVSEDEEEEEEEEEPKRDILTVGRIWRVWCLEYVVFSNPN
jgi:hypothetical protein